jgi:acetyltransferase-like isoleucine patch superfamily enzyme
MSYPFLIDNIWNKKRSELISILGKIRFSRIKPGSEKWYRIQDKLSIKPMMGIHAKKRVLFYRTTLPRCGEGLLIDPNVSIRFPQNLEIGNNVYCNRGVFITARTKIKIGDDVLIGPYVVINSGNHIYSDPNQTIRSQNHRVAPIIIEDDVWIGAHATILAGVTLGTGSVVAAGAVVTKNVAPYTVVAGIPAKMIKRRGGSLLYKIA